MPVNLSPRLPKLAYSSKGERDTQACHFILMMARTARAFSEQLGKSLYRKPRNIFHYG